MMNLPRPAAQRVWYWALTTSLAIHLLVLFIPRHPAPSPTATPRLEARLTQRQQAATTPAPPEQAAKPARSANAQARRKPARPRLLTVDGSPERTPAWTAAQKTEMDGFLNELAGQARNAPPPSLAERSLAMAREQARQMARSEAAEETVVEARPYAPPVNPFSLEMYMDGLVRRLNQSAGLVGNGPRRTGLRPASVLFRLNPDGSLKSFKVLNAGDQDEEIAFVRSVVERAVPFLPFPPDIDRAARSLGVTICIRPGWGSDAGGFSRMSDGRCR